MVTSAAKHDILIYKNENGNTITSATPFADWSNNANLPPLKTTQDIRRVKIAHFSWTYPVTGAPPPVISKTVRIPRRLKRFERLDTMVIDVVSTTGATAASYLADFYLKTTRK